MAAKVPPELAFSNGNVFLSALELIVNLERIVQANVVIFANYMAPKRDYDKQRMRRQLLG